MRIFLCYASEDSAIAEPVAHSLRSRGHQVFFDRNDLPPGRSFERRIEMAVAQSDIFVFLISPNSVTPGRFTLTELAFAKKEWLRPAGKVLPVIIAETDEKLIPHYLKAVTLLRPAGNVANDRNIGEPLF